ncbi:hypothetical protein ACFX13_032509 [Malus domestica]
MSSQQIIINLPFYHPQAFLLSKFSSKTSEMGSSGSTWSFLKLLFREKNDFHQITTISNTFGQTPRYPQRIWSGGFLVLSLFKLYKFGRGIAMLSYPDKSNFTIIPGEGLHGGSSTKLILAAQPNHLIGFLSMKTPENWSRHHCN